MLPFDVILFDVGGVLLTNGWDRGERTEVLEHFQLDHAEFESRHVAPNREWERGAVALRDYLDATVFYQPRAFSREEFFARMLAQSKLLPDSALGILAEIAASDRYLLGALNNEARETNLYRFKSFGLYAHLQMALSSCYLGLSKPDPAIYARALEMLGKPAERILFIDDRAENVAAAAETGIKAIRYMGSGTLRIDLEILGVL